MARRNPELERLEREIAMLRASLRRAHEQPGDIPFAGCGDHSCDVAQPCGMGPNGGCRCDERMLRRAVRYWRQVADQRQATIQAHVDGRLREVGRDEGIELCASLVETPPLALANLAEHLRTKLSPNAVSRVAKLEGASAELIDALSDHDGSVEDANRTVAAINKLRGVLSNSDVQKDP